MYLGVFSILILLGYSIYFICRKTQRQVWSFILTLIGVTALALALPDLVLGGRRSSVARYLIPSYLGIQIAIAYLLSAQIRYISVNLWRQKLWQIVTIVIISGGVLSCTLSFQAEAWWNKSAGIYQQKVAHIVNQTDHPLFITSWHWLLPLSHVLEPKVVILPVAPNSIVKSGRKIAVKFIANDFSNVFVYDSENVLDELLGKEPSYQIEQVYKWKQQISPIDTIETSLWKLARRQNF